MGEGTWFCYLLECADGSLYTGITNDLPRRIRLHEEGKASKCTRARRPVRLLYAEPHPDRSSAGRREAEIKKWPPSRKRALAGDAGAPPR